MKKLWALFYFSAFSLLQMDSYPLGARLFREFGARPSNFFLAACFIAILSFSFSQKIRFKLQHLAIFTVTTTLVLLNFFTVEPSMEIFYSRRPPFASYLAQSAILIWALLSYYIWLFLLKNTSWTVKDNAIIFSTYSTISVVIFDLFLVASENYAIGHYTLGLLQFYHDPFRVSGATSEPSILGAWIAFLWPMLFLVKEPRFAPHRGALVAVLLLLGLFFGGRTFLVLFGMQFVCLVSFSIFSGTAAKKFLSALILFPLLAIFSRFFFESVLDIEDNLSSMARFGSTITALIVGIENLPTGIGIGQFSYYFPSSVPDLFRASEEITYWASGDSESRLSTFNLPARVFVELGLPGVFYIVLLFLSVARQWLSIRKSFEEPTRTSVPLVVVAGCGFWLSQDQYGYQPAIFSIALIYCTALSRNTQKEEFVNETSTARSDSAD